MLLKRFVTYVVLTERIVAVTKRYCIDDAPVNYNRREGLTEDSARRAIFSYLVENTNLTSNIDKIANYRRIGKDVTCLVAENLYIHAIGDYFLMMWQEKVCGSEDFDTIMEEEYKLCCVRDNLKCLFGEGDIVNDLIDLLGLRVPFIGISYMTVGEPDCSPFEVIARN
jgi:hypothetical protein